MTEPEQNELEQDEPRLITGQVARVLNSRELVINRGSEHGVVRRMDFEVMAPEGEDIEDPETGEVLGSVERPKVAVRIVQVKPRLSVARTYRSRTKNVGGVGLGTGAFSAAFTPPKYITQYDTLKTSEETWENLSEHDSFVRTGDPVRQIPPGREQ